MFSYRFVRPVVRVSMQNISRGYERILLKFSGGMGRGPKKNMFYFGVDP